MKDRITARGWKQRPVYSDAQIRKEVAACAVPDDDYLAYLYNLFGLTAPSITLPRPKDDYSYPLQRRGEIDMSPIKPVVPTKKLPDLNLDPPKRLIDLE